MLAATETRLLELMAPAGPLRSVQGAIEFAAIMDAGQIAREKMPGAFVLPLGSTSGRNTVINDVRQMNSPRIAVVLAVSNLRDAKGSSASKELEAIFDAVRGKLLGWCPSAQHGPYTHVRGMPVSFKNNTVWWQDEFATETLLSPE